MVEIINRGFKPARVCGQPATNLRELGVYMEQSGRKSLENLSVVVNIPGQRLEPPEALSDAERAVWKRVVATRPSDWFGADTAALLAEYCRAWVLSDQVAGVLAMWDGVPEGDEFQRWLKLRDRQEKGARLLCTLATKMRLSQQARYTEKTADTATRKIAAQKPWAFGGD